MCLNLYPDILVVNVAQSLVTGVRVLRCVWLC